MGAVETLLVWDQLARNNVNYRAAELGLSHLIHIGPRLIKLAPKAAAPVIKQVASKGAANWVAATPLAGLVPSAIIAKRLFTPAIVAPVPKVIATSLITAPNAMLLAAAGLGVERLVQGLASRALGPRVIESATGTRISSLQDGRCLTKGGLGLGFARCGAVGTDEWRFERTAPRVLLTRQAVLGLVHGAHGARFFAVAEPDAPGTWWPSSAPTVRLCADRWCARCVSRAADEYVSPAADAYAALASISRCSASSTALVTLLPTARAPTLSAPPPPRAGRGLLSVLALLLVVGVALVGLARALGRLWARQLLGGPKRRAQTARAQAVPQTESERLAAEAAKVRASAEQQAKWQLPTKAPYLEPEGKPSSPSQARGRPVERQNSWERYGSRLSLPPVEKPDAKILSPAKHPLELMLELAKEAVASGSPAAQQFTEQLDEIGSPHGMDDLNNRLRAGILDLRSLAAGLKEEEKASVAGRAQDAQELAEGETSPRGPEWLQAAEAMLWKNGEKKASERKLGALAKLPKMPSGSLESARRAAGRKEGRKENRKGKEGDNSPRTQKSSRARVAPG